MPRRPRPRRAQLLVPLLVAVAVAVAACGGVPATASPPPASPATSATPSPTATPTLAPLTGTVEASVDVGDGRTLRILCRGDGPPGTPTVLLEQGLGGSTTNWTSIRGALERLARVCAYDRAGVGDSQPPPGDRTVDDLVDDLEATLTGAGLRGPYVLVAHSIGPWVSTVFTARHPDDVVGLLFIDPRGPDVTAAHLAALGEPVDGEPPLVTEIRADLAGGGYDRNEESLRFGPSEAIVSRLLGADGPLFGDRPVTVLHAERTLEELPPLPADILAAWWADWTAGQARYAAESTRGELVDVAGSGHLIMDDRPRAVIDALADLLEAVRGG